MNKLHAQISKLKDIQECSILCFCETWPGERTPDTAISPDGYMVFRADQSCTGTGKSRSGGIAALVKQSWCTDCKITSKSCPENVEFLTVRLRPFYLPGELECIIVSVGYKEAEMRGLHDMINEHEN